MTEQTTDEESWKPPIFHSESAFYRTILSEVPALIYITKERDWLLESICKAVIRLQLDGRLEKMAVNIACVYERDIITNETLLVVPNIGWDYDEDEALQFISTESWGDGITFVKVDVDYELPPNGTIKVQLASETGWTNPVRRLLVSIGKRGLLSKSMNEPLQKEDLPKILLQVAIKNNFDDVYLTNEGGVSIQRLRMHKKPKVGRFIDDLVQRRGWKPDINEEEKEELINIITGKTTQHIREILSLSMSHAGKFDLEFIEWNLATKDHILSDGDSAGLLYEGSSEDDDTIKAVIEKTRFKDIAGIDGYVEWIDRTAKRFSGKATEFGFIKPPRGALLLGPPGTGKTMMAKATANAWDFGMIRVKAHDLLHSHWGETEQLFLKIMKKANEEAPCILFFDEMEKLLDQSSGAASGSTDFLSGFKTQLLEFMQENEEKVFVIGTTNELGSLPPEIVERFDGRWFVNLPDASAREKILKIHCVKRKQKVTAKVLKSIAAETEGYSGRGLEDIVDEAMSIAFDEGAPGVKKEHLIRASRGSKPVSITHGNVIRELQKLVEQGLIMDASGKIRSPNKKMLDDVSIG